MLIVNVENVVILYHNMYTHDDSCINGTIYSSSAGSSGIWSQFQTVDVSD